ncbi:MAG: hypothetical protein K2Y32_19050 [Candidatus Obscuribacterales bacterium]|nr:hypothetical protein [Candidatus Obscuribacterales bacterium]
MDKITEAKEILRAFGLPTQQQNERSALIFLALCGVKRGDKWADATRKSLGVRLGIMEFIAVEYGKVYKENTRESIRKHSLHQFHQAKVIDYNPDDPSIPTNSSKAHYAITPAALEVIKLYGTKGWAAAVENFKATHGTLLEIYARHREQDLVPVTLPNGKKFGLSPGKHNILQAAIIEEFGPRYAKGAQVLYLGDTMKKDLFVDSSALSMIGIPINQHDKLPDVILHDRERNWLFLIEAVTSVGPMSPKRLFELEDVLKQCSAGIIYVTAFLDFAEFKKWSKEIAWETEVWIAEVPDHLIHYNGDRFFGPR